MKIFLTASFPDQIDPTTGEVQLEHKSFMQYLLDGLREDGYDVFCALEDEGWKQGSQPPEIGLTQDLELIDDSDVVVALVTDKPLTAVQFELGYAVAKGKRVIMARANDDQLSRFNQGTVGAGLVTHISFDNVAMLLDQLVVAITAPE